MKKSKFRAWDGFRMTTSGIQFNSTTGELEFAPDGVLLECTGIKDKNGVEIWEDDIIIHEGRNAGKPMLVIRHNDGSWNGDYGLKWMLLYEIDQVEVIGNVHQNPELVER